MIRKSITLPISRETFLGEIEAWCRRVGVTPRRIQIQPMTRKWASCSTEGRITFSNDLLSQAKRIREEVIVHELVHLLVPNHGKLFKASMRAYLPGWNADRAATSRFCRSTIVRAE